MTGQDMAGESIAGRTLWRLTGKDVLTFLQGLVTNDVLPLGRGPGLVWTGFLTPQGKYLADFFVIRREGDDDSFLIDIPEPLAASTLKRLTMYRLRADVQIVPADGLHPTRGTGPAPAGALPDPRAPSLGWRAYGPDTGGPAVTNWAALRVAAGVPEYPDDLLPDDSYILEMGFERLNGVNFRKGCYVGQEVTARMKHKTELRKGLRNVRLDGPAAPGTPVMAGDRVVGRLGTVAGNRALAYLRHDQAEGPLLAGSSGVFPE